MVRKCPTCNSNDGVRIIFWGMPGGPPDESKYFIGGCLLDDQMPDYKCISCGWEGFGKTNAKLASNSMIQIP